MTDLFAPESDAAEDFPARPPDICEVFNPDHSVGVACNLGGAIVGLHIGDAVRDNTDAWLAAEILRVARLAYQKALLGRRLVMTRDGVLPHVLDGLDLPTQAKYTAMESTEFGDHR